MNILLIIIIAGLALLSLGSPDKIMDAGKNISELVQQFPDRLTNSTQTPPPAVSTDEPNFSNVGEQPDIPVAEVLGNKIISPDTKLAMASHVKSDSQHESFAHRDHHTLEDVHAVNAAALTILDRISSNY